MTDLRPVDVAAGPCGVDATAYGTCALCGALGDAAPIAKVLSDNFLDADRLPFRSRCPMVLCPACSWAFRHRGLRRQPTETTREGMSVLTPQGLSRALSRPVGGDRAVCVPILGRKHLYPWVRWGTVMSDHGERPWGEAEVRRLELVRWLRVLGFGESALREPSPRWTVMATVPDYAGVLVAWDDLRSWRQDETIEVAIRATRKPKEAHGDDAGDD